jgi:CRP-like cAMP-binding protein
MFDKFKDYLFQYENLSKEKLAKIEQYMTILFLEKGEYFLKGGRICHQIGFVIEGLMRVYKIEDSREITCAFAGENQFVVDLESFNFKKPASEYIQAINSTKLILLTYNNLHKLFEEMPDFIQLYHQILQKNLLEKLKLKNILLTEEPTTRYIYFLENFAHILQKAPLIHIASFLGITPQSLSRIRKNLI